MDEFFNVEDLERWWIERLGSEDVKDSFKKVKEGSVTFFGLEVYDFKCGFSISSISIIRGFVRKVEF